MEWLKLTVCPCPSQPAEKLTAPGSNLWFLVFLMKLLLFIRQFGGVLSLALFSLTDLFNQGAMLAVARWIPFWFKPVGSLHRKKDGKNHLLLFRQQSGKVPKDYPSFGVHNSQRFGKWTKLRVGEFLPLLVTPAFHADPIVFLNIPSQINWMKIFKPIFV